MFRAYEDCGKFQRTLVASKSQRVAFEAAEKAQTVNPVYITMESSGYPETTIAFRLFGEDWTI